MVGKTLGHYEILEPLGAGGMGEVYRARDTKLDRDVAIKVLPDDLATDAERLARFEREAKLLAALNHSNIGAIYGLEETDSIHFLVLELIEGESLERRLRRGAMPVADALDIARQIAEALEAAHDAGIIHRDVKPANVLLTGKGGVKVLDFGIAKSTLLDGAANAALTEQATSLTLDGTLMGTPPYMAPEQIRGEEADKRADIWAFGCVVYEMLTGRGAFVRETVADTLVAVLDAEPDWGAVPRNTPNEIRSLVRRCLRKDANRRLRDIGDARIEIEEAADRTHRVETMTRADAMGKQPLWPWAITAIAVVVALVSVAASQVGWLGLGTSARGSAAATSAVPVEFSFDPPEGESTGLTVNRPMAMSPDGMSIVFPVNGPGGRYERRLDADQLTLLEGVFNWPFFSPDGESIVSFRESTRELVTVLATGGNPQPIVSVPVGDFHGVVWTAGDDIIWAQPHGVYRVPAAGGEPDQLDQADWKINGLLPGGQVLGSIVGPTTISADDAQIAAFSPETRQTTIIWEGGYSPQYVEPGYLVYASAGALYAVAFDPDRLELSGPHVTVLDGVSMNQGPSRYAQYVVSPGGTLAYQPGRDNEDYELVQVRHDGTEIGPVGNRAMPFNAVQASPDGTRLAVSVGWEAHQLWLFDMTRSVWEPIRDEDSHAVTWTRDGDALFFSTGGQRNIYRLRYPFVGVEPEPLIGSDNFLGPESVSPSGEVLMFHETTTLKGRDLRVLPLVEGGEPIDLIATADNEFDADFHPGGQFFAFRSNRSGVAQVYVAPLADPRRAKPVSIQGGNNPRWSADGKELYYRYDGAIWAVEVQLEPEVDPGVPSRLFERADWAPGNAGRPWDVLPDGTFVIVRQTAPWPRPTQINVVVNWVEELKRLVPTDGSR